MNAGAPPPKRVLVCDDEPQMTRLIAEVLKFRGYEVHTENDPARVEGVALVGRFDLIVLDLMMPGLDGLELLTGLRKREGYVKHVPVIVLTAKRLSPEDRTALQRAKATVLEKPFRIDDFVERVRATAGT